MTHLFGSLKCVGEGRALTGRRGRRRRVGEAAHAAYRGQKETGADVDGRANSMQHHSELLPTEGEDNTEVREGLAEEIRRDTGETSTAADSFASKMSANN